MKETQPIPADGSSQSDLYAQAADQYGPALEWLARAYESDPEKRRDLSQDIVSQFDFLGQWMPTMVFVGISDIASSHTKGIAAKAKITQVGFLSFTPAILSQFTTPRLRFGNVRLVRCSPH